MRCWLVGARVAGQRGRAIIAATLASVLLMSNSAAHGAESPFELADLEWVVVNDNVMGGRSQGGFNTDDGEIRFAGRTNTNGGGFSSIRSRPVQIDLSAHEGIQLRVKGDGRRYTWRLTTDARWRGREVAYWADFETVAGRWVTVDIPFSRFIPRFRGSRLPGPQLEPGKITGMGLMIYDGQDGAFELRLAAVSAYPAR
jgi:NADH dehydrogenase [ubiquinone] 1 alpha subcomplex assembly factor 1